MRMMLELSLSPEPSTPFTSDETATALPAVNDVPELGITEDAAHKYPLSDSIADAAHTSTTFSPSNSGSSHNSRTLKRTE
jgi:hypothetical protein